MKAWTFPLKQMFFKVPNTASARMQVAPDEPFPVTVNHSPRYVYNVCISIMLDI